MATSQKIVLYTCSTSNRDAPKFIEFKNDFQYVMFSDRVSSLAKDWEIRPLAWHHPNDPVRTARYHKHHPHQLFPDHDISIWLDATHWPYADLNPLLKSLGEHSIGAMRHFARTTIEAEAATIEKANMDKKELIHKQLAKYRIENFTDHLLYSTTCLVRRHNKETKDLQELWWSELESGSRRDQLSFTYCLWKLGVECAVIPGFCRQGPSAFFRMKSHYKKPIIRLL